ncbi:MAG: helix-turn-helix transcriptional regulator [Ruminococcaceae bacterium]|nr:helix-turn-helix transcriptional regulator [Oscillospiraceae bacterium]
MYQYVYDDFEKVVEVIKRRIHDKRNKRITKEGKSLTQQKLVEGLHLTFESKKVPSRTTITKWEDMTNKSIPSLEQMLLLCNFFDCDINYFLGKNNIESEDNITIAKSLNLSLETVETLRHTPEYGSFLNDVIISKKLNLDIIRRINQLGKNMALEDILETSFKKEFFINLRAFFDEFYASIFPMDMSLEAFEKYLCNVFPYNKSFEPAKFLENNFEEDGKNFVLNKFEDFERATSNEQYKMIMASIADISYNYFISTQVAELSKQRVTITLLEMVEKIITDKANSLKEKMKNYADTNRN